MTCRQLTSVRLIAIMLGRFKMSIKACQDKYAQLMGQVFPHHTSIGKWARIGWSGAQYDAGELEKLIKEVIVEELPEDPNGPDALLVPEDWRDERCKM